MSFGIESSFGVLTVLFGFGWASSRNHPMLGSQHEQREVIRKAVDAEPNQGLEWNRVGHFACIEFETCKTPSIY
eukprot:6488219-Amphidinium_carterae.2